MNHNRNNGTNCHILEDSMFVLGNKKNALTTAIVSLLTLRIRQLFHSQKCQQSFSDAPLSIKTNTKLEPFSKHVDEFRTQTPVICRFFTTMSQLPVREV